MKKWRNKILSAVLTLSLLLTTSSFAFAEGDTDALKYVKISGVTAVGGSSQLNPAQGNEGGYSFAFDGNTATFWHTDWSNNRTDPNGYIIFDLGRKVSLSRLEFMPRQDNSTNGRIGQYEISVSSSFDPGMTKETLEGTWSVAATGTWNWTNYTKPNVQQANLTNTFARYVKLKAIKTTASHVCAAEIYCYENTVDPVITVHPESIFSSQNVELSVTAETSAQDATLSYQWYSYNAGETAENAQIVVNGTSNTLSVTPTTDSKFYYVVVTQTNGNNIGTTTSNVAEVNAGRTDYQITKSNGLSVLDYSSCESANPPELAIDGKTNTIWHSNWHDGTDGSGFDRERYISFDLGDEYYLSKVRYLPRDKTGGVNGRFKDCDIYISSNGENWTLLKSVTGWTNAVEWKEVTIDIPVKTRYVKVVGVTTYTSEDNAENKFATAAEIEIYADTTVETTDIITEQPQGGTISSTGSDALNLNVSAKDGSTYQWYSNSDDSYVGATPISSATNSSYEPADETKYYFVEVTNGDKKVYSDIVLVHSTVAKIGETKYSTLSEAIGAANANDVIEVTRDVDLTSGITINKNLTIKSTDGNKFILNRTEASKGETLFSVNGGANVTFENVTVDGGAVWSGTVDSVLERGNTNDGITSTKEFFSVNGSSTLNLNSVVLENNSRTGNGGVITVDSSIVSIDNSVIKNNSTAGFSSVMWASKDTSNVTITNSEIFGNYSTQSSGTGSTLLFEQGAELTISGGTIHNNNGGGNGGAVFLFGESTVTVKDNAVISNNKSGNGGAFTLKHDQAVLNIEEANITNNIGGSDGGAIYVSKGTANVGAATISGNHANWGGAVYIGGGTANFTGTIITGNSATSGRGGAFNINKIASNITTTVNINEGTEISSNTATANGGAINIQDGIVNLNGGSIINNTATQNGGAIYLGFSDGSTNGNGTLNIGSAGKDFALTISGNTATNGNGIYYGENGTFNLNAKLNLQDEIYLHTNGNTIKQKCDLTGNAPITLVGNRKIAEFINISNSEYYSSALNVFRVKDGNPAVLKPTAMADSNLSVVRESGWSNTKALENDSTYYKGIENNLYTVTGSENITYTWYEKVNGSNEFTEVGDNLDSLSDGEHTVYCVAKSSDGKYMVSDVATVTVKEFVPCSQAIDKFKGI